MNSRKQNQNHKKDTNKVEEPIVSYGISKKGIEAKLDFDKEFENGYTVEEAKAESIKKIREWWVK
ncbi:MAG: hypothetical protein V4548_08865 [Bacteroidota bacterium]